MSDEQKDPKHAHDEDLAPEDKAAEKVTGGLTAQKATMPKPTTTTTPPTLLK